MSLNIKHLKLGPTRKLQESDLSSLHENQVKLVSIIQSPYSAGYNFGLFIDEDNALIGIDNGKLIYAEEFGRVACGYTFQFVAERVFLTGEHLLVTGGKIRNADVLRFLAMGWYKALQESALPLSCDELGIPLVIHRLKQEGIVNDSVYQQLKLIYTERDLPEITPAGKDTLSVLSQCVSLIGDREITAAATAHLALYQYIIADTVAQNAYVKTQDTIEVQKGVQKDANPELFPEEDDFFPEVKVEDTHDEDIIEAAKKIFNATEVRQEESGVDTRKRATKKGVSGSGYKFV